MNIIAKAKLWPWRTIGTIAAGIAAVAIAGWLIYRVFIAPDVAARDAAQAKQNEQAAKGEVTVTRDVMNTMDNRAAEQEQRKQTVEESSNAIRNAPGAQEPVTPDLDAAGRCAIRRLRNQAC